MLYYLSGKIYIPNLHMKRNYIQIDDSENQVQFLSQKKKFPVNNEIIEIDVQEQIYSPKKYAELQECPTKKLTKEEMQGDPQLLFMQLEKKYQKYGAVKLVANQSWNPPFMFNSVDKGITTRIQVLQQLNEGKSFEQKIQAYSIKAYESYAKNFQFKYKNKIPHNNCSPAIADEEQFWGLQNDPKYKDHKTKVQYAADLPVDKYGSGFPVSNTINSKDLNFDYQKSLWNLNNTYKSPSSLLQIVDIKGEKISGVTSPWVYMGMKFASFCWHVQDLYINSLNYNHKGATKTWYIVPGQDKQKVDKFVKIKYAKLLESKPDLLHRITLMFDPLELIKSGIKVYKINQEERCYVITFGKVYHSGFSHGFNVGQAINYVTPLTFPFIKQAMRQYQQYIGKKMAVFPHQWLILENYFNISKIQANEQYKKFIIKSYEEMVNIQYSQIADILKKRTITQFAYIPKKNLKYDRNLCVHCKNYCYLSFIKCLSCNKNYCLTHMIDKCQGQSRLIIRQPLESRKKILFLLNKAKLIIE